jgi:COP9 signalosome complex subunit 7
VFNTFVDAVMDDPQSTAAPALIGCQGLEQFLLLTKTARGPAAVDLIHRVLEAPGVYVFGELLETECVKDLVSGENASYVKLLELFAYGTYNDYKRKKMFNFFINF